METYEDYIDDENQILDSLAILLIELKETLDNDEIDLEIFHHDASDAINQHEFDYEGDEEEVQEAFAMIRLITADIA